MDFKTWFDNYIETHQLHNLKFTAETKTGCTSEFKFQTLKEAILIMPAETQIDIQCHLMNIHTFGATSQTYFTNMSSSFLELEEAFFQETAQ